MRDDRLHAKLLERTERLLELDRQIMEVGGVFRACDLKVDTYMSYKAAGLAKPFAFIDGRQMWTLFLRLRIPFNQIPQDRRNDVCAGTAFPPLLNEDSVMINCKSRELIRGLRPVIEYVLEWNLRNR